MNGWWWLVGLMAVIAVGVPTSTYFRRCACGRFRLGFHGMVHEIEDDGRWEKMHTEDHCMEDA